jgi:predicted ArsR family transcriptional regulator
MDNDHSYKRYCCAMTTPADDLSRSPVASVIRAVAVLDERLRRGMYEFIRQARRPVSRDEAAASVGISRKLAAFHLDKLVEAGVLSARYGRVERSRRVGRAPKLYEPSAMDIQLSIPGRNHDLLAEILLDAALAQLDGERSRDSAIRVAHEHGAQVGTSEGQRRRPGRLGAERALTIAAELLERRGYEPARESPTCVRLRNCPFHPLTDRSRELVCGINHAFIAGLLEGLRASTAEASLDPRAGECCVELRAVGTAESGEDDRGGGRSMSRGAA